MAPGPDVLFAWLNVHGGSFHKLLRLREELVAAGLSCELLFSVGPPRGLKIGADVPEALLPELAAQGIHFLPRSEVLQRVGHANPRLLITDTHHDPDLPALIGDARKRGVSTAQMATQIGDFTCHGAEHLLLQHPLTLFFELEYNRTPESSRLFEARSVHFTGNIFFEPTQNELAHAYASRGEFCARYGFDPARPLCLWLPNYPDARHPSYGQIVRAAEEAGLNLMVKLHPWEYAFKKHGVDTWGLGKTSDEIWGARAVDESDTTWAYHFCDLAIMRTSTTCLELPFWNKPAILLPSTAYAALVRAQALMVAPCTLRLDSVEALAQFLKAGPLPSFGPAAYAAARSQVRLDTTRDAYAQTVDAVQAILAAPKTAGPQHSRSGFKRLYDPHISLSMSRSLSPTRRLRFEAGRLWRRLTA